MADLTGHWRNLYESKYLGAWNLFDSKTSQYREVEATIDRVTQEEVIGEGGRRSTPILLYLSGRKGPIHVPMILSKTSGKTLEIMYGESPKAWEGKRITLYVRKDKRVRKGTGSVLTIRNTKAGADLREELEARRGPAIDEGEFAEPASAAPTEPAPMREPGED